jgi:exo-beta-1,3-glucanase (GH17 family)
MKGIIAQGIRYLLILSSVFLLFCCVQISNKRVADADGNYAIQQRKADLLSGVSKAVCYSGFRAGQHPDRGDGAVNPSRDEILEDLNILAAEGFELIRLYDSGENSQTVLELIKENKLNIRVMLGIWLSAELSNHETCAWLTEPIPDEVLANNKLVNRAEVEKGISLANRYKDIVVAVNVGNEALVDWNDHKVDVDTLITYVKQVKKHIKQPVTVAENYEWWAANGKKLAAELDFIAIHIYPIWEGRDIEEGIEYSIQNVQKVRNALPDSRIVISEAGWATISSEFGARAGEEKQKQYYDWLMEWTEQMKITTFFFAAFDEPWKGNPNDPFGAEKHWGLYFVDRTPKLVLKK